MAGHRAVSAMDRSNREAVATATTGDSQQGRALLQCAVHAIQDNRWDDLTHLLQTHASTLQAARLRLEHRKLEKHAARVPKTVDDPPVASTRAGQAAAAAAAAAGPSKCMPPSKEPETANGVEVHAGRRERLPVSTRAGRALLAVCRWADQHPLQACVLVQVLSVACYAPAFWYRGYKMDDTVGIERNPNVVAPQVSLHGFLTRDYWGLPMHGSGWTNKSFRPLTTLTFRWNYLLHGLESSGFFIANVLMHVLTSVLVGTTATHVIGLSGSMAAVAALLFGVHPVHTENVLYLVGRADILATLLGLMAMISYSWLFCPAPALGSEGEPPKPWANNAAWMVFPAVLLMASGLCKETGFTLFAIFMGMELLDFIEAHTAAVRAVQKLHARFLRRTRNRAIVLAVMTFFVFIARCRHTGGTTLNMSPQDNPISFESSKLVRMLSYSYLHGVYTRLLVWPQFLCYDYSMDAIPLVQTFADCRMMLPLAAYIGLFGAITVALRAPVRYRRGAMISLALMVVPFSVASNILFPVGTVIGERLLYTPSAGFCLAVLVLVDSFLGPILARRPSRGAGAPPVEGATNGATHSARPKKGGSSNRAVSRERQKPAPAAANGAELAAPIPQLSPQGCRHLLRAGIFGGLLAGVLTVRTLLRVRVWESSDSLFINDGAIQPTSSKVQFNLGITHMQNQDWDLAVEALIRCAWADPLSSLPFYRIGQIEIMRGRFVSAEKYLEAAIDKFGASLMVRDEEVFHDLALAMFQNGKVEAAETRLRVALQINPDFAKGWNNLACCLVAHSPHDATRALRKAVSLAPGNPQYWANLALLAGYTQDPATASGAWRRAVEIWPDQPEHRDCTWEFAPAG